MEIKFYFVKVFFFGCQTCDMRDRHQDKQNGFFKASEMSDKKQTIIERWIVSSKKEDKKVMILICGA